MRAFLAFDKFKDALSARQACEITARVLRQRHPDWGLDLCPLADGGEGFAEILTTAAGGQTRSFPVLGPRREPVNATLGLVPWSRIPVPAQTRLALPPGTPPGAPVAVVEMAAASGLALLAADRRDPWQTTTHGTGELLLAAAGLGAAVVLLGVGGSATHDLGLGALDALGFRFLTATGNRVHPPIPARWSEIARISGHAEPGLPPVRIACDVTNPLLGPRGAAAVYGPQKGLRPEDLPRLEHAGARLALMLCAHTGRPDALMDAPGAGAAGGIAFGLMAGVNASLLPGFDLVADWLDLDARLDAADLVITGEGRFDESSLSGKGPGAVVARALARGKPVQVFAGSVAAVGRAGLGLHAITPPDVPLARALREAPDRLAAAVQTALP